MEANGIFVAFGFLRHLVLLFCVVRLFFLEHLETRQEDVRQPVHVLVDGRWRWRRRGMLCLKYVWRFLLHSLSCRGRRHRSALCLGELLVKGIAVGGHRSRA
eukprot:scaffold6348_cov259-Pinguiococcus_pyrenoidosus.AAC.3